MKLKHTKVATLAATLITFGSLAGGANAATVTFDLTGAGNFTMATQDGLTVSVTDVMSGDNPGVMDRDADGITILGDPSSGRFNVTSFTLSFSEEVTLTSYSVGYVEETLDGGEQIIFTSGDVSTTESGPFATGARDFATQISGTSFSVSTNNNDVGDIIQFNSLTVDTVPEPSSALLLGLGALGFVARRKRTS